MKVLGVALVIGLAAGIAARALMRVIALINGSATGFSLEASAMIVGLFVLAAVGMFAGARIARRWRPVGALVAFIACLPLWVPGASIAVSEIEASAKGSAAQVAAVGAVALVILASFALVPLAGWRLGRQPA
jgi:hypothetical protein